MLALRSNFQGIRMVEGELSGMARNYPSAVRAGLADIARDVHGEALKWLSGAGALGRDRKTRTMAGSGVYPVPRRTGNLARLLDFVEPGHSKSSNGSAFTAGPFETVIFDSADYANVIHEGTGSSRKFGPRRYLVDALNQVRNDGRLLRRIEDRLERIMPHG